MNALNPVNAHVRLSCSSSLPISVLLTLSLLLFFALPTAPIGAQEEDLFSGTAVLVTEPADTDRNLAATLEKRPGVEIGGDLSLAWSVNPKSGALSTGGERSMAGMGLFLDARPDERFRIYIRGRYSMTATDFSGAVSIEELFADLGLEKFGKLRAGKQNAVWGLGYWWSPADILSLYPKDEYRPEAAREGTIAIKYALAMGLDTLSLYATAQGAAQAANMGLAGRYEFVLAGSEFGVGAYWRPDGDVKPRIAGTGSFRTGAIDWYAEAVAAFGSERRRVRFDSGIPGDDPVVETPDALLFQGALGFSWSKSEAEGKWAAHLSGEYYFNGAGIADGVSYVDHVDEMSAIVAAGGLSSAELAGYGRHYGAVHFSLGDLWSSGFGFGSEWRSNLAEFSGFQRSVAIFEPASSFRVEAGLKSFYGERGSEYARAGPAGFATTSLELWEKLTLSADIPVWGDSAQPRISLEFAGKF